MSGVSGIRAQAVMRLRKSGDGECGQAQPGHLATCSEVAVATPTLCWSPKLHS